MLSELHELWKAVRLSRHSGREAALTHSRISLSKLCPGPSLQDPGGGDGKLQSDLHMQSCSWQTPALVTWRSNVVQVEEPEEDGVSSWSTHLPLWRCVPVSEWVQTDVTDTAYGTHDPPQQQIATSCRAVQFRKTQCLAIKQLDSGEGQYGGIFG